MELFLIGLRSLLMVIGTLMVLLYVVGNLWKKLPAEAFKFKTHDWVMFGVVAAMFAFGTNSYWGFLACVPMILVKIVFHTWIQKNRVRGSGRWMEVQWTKMTPRGFQMPKDAMSQIQKLPGDQHIMVPRFASIMAVNFFAKNMRKNVDKMPTQMKGQQDLAFGMVDKITANVKRLESGKTEKIDLPFGMLKITRL
jgi:hypothetical protein